MGRETSLIALSSGFLFQFILLLAVDFSSSQTPEELPYNPGCKAWYSPIPENVQLDPASASVSRTIDSNARAQKTKLSYMGEAPGTYLANSTVDDYYQVTFRGETYPFRVPSHVIDTTSMTHDAPIVIYDRDSDFYGPWTELRLFKAQIDHPGKQISASGGGLFKYNTDGITRDPWGRDESCSYAFLGGGTGSGMSWIGMIRPYDIASGAIKHAIRVYFSPCDFGPDTYRWPAVKSDQGGGSCCGCAEMGMRIQLDPSVDCMSRTVPTSTDEYIGDPRKQLEFLRMLCVALQEYGGIFVDGTGNRGISIMMEDNRTADWNTLLGEPHPDVGWSWIARDLGQPSDPFSASRNVTSGIPWNMFRVVETLYESDRFLCQVPPTATEAVTTITVFPVGDAYVQGPPDRHNTNFGSVTSIRIKYSGDDLTRVGYIKWALPSSLTQQNLHSVMASITIERFHSSGFDGELQARAAFHDWNESTITFMDRANAERGVGHGPVLCSWRPTDTATAQKVDLTDAARLSLARNEGFVAIVIWSTKGASGQDIWLPSKEGSGPGVPLEVTTCDSGHCSSTSVPTTSPTTARPTTLSPPTLSPTTAAPNGSSTTTSPTTPSPTLYPTTTAATLSPTSSPTTPSPTTPSPTTPSPRTTPSPTTPSPTTADGGAQELTYVGNNGSPASEFPLSKCAGDCDSDYECTGDLLCYKGSDAQVPGCMGTRDGSTNYCFDLNDLCTPGELCEVGNNGGKAFPLNFCQGDCDSDSECAGDLLCYKGSSAEVPGCSGTRSGWTNYCFDLNQLGSPGELVWVGNNGSPAPAFPLERCWGDCDSDFDCAGDLLCYRGSDTQVPGCTGTRDGSTNYCFDLNDLCTSGELCELGNNGGKAFPLSLCQGDCDDDSECAGDLICYKGSSYPVAGCTGMREGWFNYCVQPSARRQQRQLRSR